MNTLQLLKTLLFVFLTTGLFAQTLQTTTLTYKDNPVTVTKDIDPMFLGTYSSNIGGVHQIYTLDLDEQTNFEWGAAINEGELSTIDIMEYANGKMISYLAYVIYLKDKTNGEEMELMLYELDGDKFLGKAKKEESVAENR